MKTKYFFLTILLILTIGLCWSNEEFIKVGTISTEPGEENIIFFIPEIGAGIYPTSFTIYNDQLLICNMEKINVYDLNLKYKGAIRSEEFNTIGYSRKFSFDDNGNIIAYAGKGLAKVDKNGKLFFKIKKRKLPDQIINFYNFFPFGDYILYYNDKKIPQLLNNNGETLNVEERDKIIDAMIKKNLGTIRNEAGIKDKIDDFLKANNLILYGDRLLATYEYTYAKYFEFIKANIKGKELKDKEYVPHVTDNENYFIGFDKYDNTYWKTIVYKSTIDLSDYYCEIKIYSKYGEGIKYIHNPIGDEPHAVAPNGDIYIMERKNEGITIYKVKAEWNE